MVTNTFRLLDLFSGIGGFSLGLERTGGFRTVAFCEIDPFCRRVLAKHWPGVPIYDDVRTLTADALFRDGIAVDAICGGFPCQDVSLARARAGLDGERSGLWAQYARIIGELRPRYGIVENTPGLLSLGMGTVLGDLAALGYDAEWHCIPASAAGAPHRRDRIWIVANSICDRWLSQRDNHAEYDGSVARASGQDTALADAIGPRLEGRSILARHLASELAAIERGGSVFPDADGTGRAQPVGSGEALSRTGQGESAGPQCSGWNPWLVEPDVGRVAHGVSARVDRLRSLGNAVVPQIPEIIGRAILASEGAR